MKWKYYNEMRNLKTLPIFDNVSCNSLRKWHLGLGVSGVTTWKISLEMAICWQHCRKELCTLFLQISVMTELWVNDKFSQKVVLERLFISDPG